MFEIFGKGQLTWLRKFFPFSHGIPSHDTLGRLSARLDHARFEQCFREWINELHPLTHGEVIAFDGKRMWGSYDLQDRKSALHMVSAYASEQRLCLGQLATEEKSNEITAIPKLLDTLTLEGATITIDAMGGQKGISKKIVAKRADDLLQVKNHQKGLLAQIAKVFSLTPGTEVHQTQELDHGRVEQRTCTVIEDLTLLDDD
ncbi:MAG: ISAs1 family transposase, partial [Bacteroidota bacterium]